MPLPPPLRMRHRRLPMPLPQRMHQQSTLHPPIPHQPQPTHLTQITPLLQQQPTAITATTNAQGYSAALADEEEAAGRDRRDLIAARIAS
jgi:hypothetical protein